MRRFAVATEICIAAATWSSSFPSMKRHTNA